MDRRAWPWKKKSSDKLFSAADSTDSFQTVKQEDQENVDTAKTLSEQLSAALSDVAAKEEMVKQHVKVAEEAVTGWEKAEAEAVAFKQKLDDALQQNLAAEDRVLHLDGALKECMRQLRHVREEQEQRIHETVMKKTKEWEKAHTDLNMKLTDFGSQLVEARAENNAMSKSLQERARVIAEINEAKALADAEVKVLQVKLSAIENANTKLKYETHVLRKELEIRTEEKEYNKKVGDAANKQHLENVKKIARLEAECQRLRLLVRKRLPGPGALAQMRLEVEVLGRENAQRPKKGSSCRRSANHSALSEDSMSETLTRDSDGLSDRVAEMEEETNFLKEVLAKKNHELQAARLMCLRTASKLSTVEEQFESLSLAHSLPKLTVGSSLPLGSSKENRIASVSKDGATKDEVSGAESWASALMTELAHFKKEEVATYSSLGLMDDFSEMEKLASLSSENTSEFHGNTGKTPKVPQTSSTVNETENTTENCKLCNELRSKLAHVEKQVSTLVERESKIGVITVCLKQHLASIFKAQLDGTGLNKLLEEAKSLLEEMEESLHSCFNHVISDVKLTLPRSPSCQSQESNVKEITHISTISDVKGWDVGPELADAVHKVLDLIEGLAQSDYSVPFPYLLAEYTTEPASAIESSEDHRWKNFEFESSIQGLVTLCQTLLQGKVDVVDFMAEVVSALDWLVGYIFSAPSKSFCIRKQLHRRKGSSALSDYDVATSTNSLIFQPQKTSNFDASKGEIQATLSVKEALQNRLESEMTKLTSLEAELSQLKFEKDEISREYEVAKEFLENLKRQLQASEQQVVDVKAQLATVLEKKAALERNFTDLLHEKELAESELLTAKDDLKKFQIKAEVLQEKLLGETNSHLDSEKRLAELQQQQLIRSQSTERKSESRNSALSATEDLRPQKEQEIASAAEKLAECQKSIFVLGKQLKALGASKDMVDTSFSSPLDSKSKRDHMCFTQESGDGSYRPSIEQLKAGHGYGWSRKEHDRRAECGSIQGYKSYIKRSLELHPDQRGQTGNRCNGVTSYINNASSYKGSSLKSPVHGDLHQDSWCIPKSPLEEAITSPGRSPARFLSLKQKFSGGQEYPKHVNNGGSVSSSEKHGGGFSRFFLRNKSGH